MQTAAETCRTLAIFVAGLIFGFMIFWTFYSYPAGFGQPLKMQLQESSNVLTRSRNVQVESNCEQTEDERNQVSIMLNQKLKALAQLRCSMGAKTSEGGGYCPKKKSHFTDKKLCEFLKQFFTGKKVASFGESRFGYYKEILEPFCQVYDGYDGAALSPNETEGNVPVKFLDLSVPQYGLPMYDIVMSLEVAEHIPKQFEQNFLDNLARYANEGIILSWAVPGQPGYAHVNNRPSKYAVEQMKKRGFYKEIKITGDIKKACAFGTLKNNVNYYSRTKPRV